MIIKQEILQLKPWVLAARPKTLPICMAPIFLGTVLAKLEGGSINWVLSALAFMSLLFLQAGTNVVNDAFDYKKGADTDERLGPKRMTQAGLLSFDQVLKGGIFCFALALLLGIPLMLAGGWTFFLILVVAAACGYLYTGGPYPLAYYGLGEPFIFIFYGLIGVPALYYLQTHSLPLSVWIGASQMGFLAMVPNAINNLRDIKTDAKANKKTLAVQFGSRFAKWEITLFSFAPFLVGLLWIAAGFPWLAYLPFLVFPFAKKNVQAVWQSGEGATYTQCFGQCIFILFFFTLFLALGIFV